MQNKWKYKVVNIKVPMFSNAEKKVEVQQEALARLGMEGWELVNTILAYGETSPTFYFKRSY